MTKIVYNACYGGFGVSEAAVMRYAEIKGIAVYPERDKKYAAMDIITYWLVPPSERIAPIDGDAWHEATPEQRRANNEAYRAQTLDVRNIDRADTALAQVVEELGREACGKYAHLKIANIDSGSKYRIEEYDGLESVMTPDDYEWSVAP